MELPLQITFHELPSSPALEAEIRRAAAELETFFDRIISCHVVVEAPHRRHQKGNHYHVRLVIGVPGMHVVVTRAHDGHEGHEDPYFAVQSAFKAARRQLEDHAQLRRGEVKTHAYAGN
jgi:ribosome-associated translation inhibitor RaiA